MLLNYAKSQLPKCQVAKHVRFPKIRPTNTDRPLSHAVKQFYSSSFHITYDNYYATLYYMIKDVIYFYNTTKAHSNSLVPLYDYRSEKYHLVEAGLNYNAEKAILESWYCVKSPNGNICVVYIRWHSKREKALCVYNLTKDKIVYYTTYITSNIAYSELIKESKLASHPDEYSYILANSFVVIYKLIDIGFRIDLVDLVSETVDTFSYTLHDYVKGLLDIVNDKTEKKRLRKILSKNFGDLITERMILLWDVEHVECIIDNREGSVPFIKFLKLHFSISEKSKIFKRVSSALLVSCSFENNELSVQFTTGTDKAIELAYDPAFNVTIPSDATLFSRTYKLNASYDITKSYPYYIYKVSPKYIFTRCHVFEKLHYKSNDYILNTQLSNLYNDYGLVNINGINILKDNKNIVAQLDKNYGKQEQKLGVHIVGFDNDTKPKLINFIDTYKIRKFLQEKQYEQNLHLESFIDVSEFVFNIRIYEKIMEVMRMKEDELKSMGKRILYYYYLDKTEGLLYVLIVLLPEVQRPVLFPEIVKYEGVDAWLCKCNVRETTSPCKVITKIRIYDNNITKDIVNLEKNDVSLLEILRVFTYNNILDSNQYERFYIYDYNFMIINNKLSIEVKDIRKNRINILQYIKQHTYSGSYSVYQDNFLICENSIRLEDYTSVIAYQPLVFIDLQIVKPIQCGLSKTK